MGAHQHAVAAPGGTAIAVLVDDAITKIAGASPPTEVEAAPVTLVAAYDTPPGIREGAVQTPDA